MKRDTFTSLLIILVSLVCCAQYATTADAADRRRGVSPPETVSGIVISATSEELMLRNEAGDHTLRINTQTRMEGDVGVSAQVRARYVTNEKGEHIAVHVAAKHEVIELRGVIQEITTTGFVLSTARGEVSVTIDETTIVVVGGVVAMSGDLAVGDRVEVHALPMGDSGLLALLVVAETENIELHGMITALSDASLTLRSARGELEIGLTSATVVRIYGREGTLADLRVGMHVEIDAERTADGSLVALVVKVEHDYDLLEIHGIVASVSASEMTVLARHGEEITFAIVLDTIIMRGDQVITTADIDRGDLVEVKAVREGEGGLVAVRIKVEDHEHDFREIEGTIASVEGSLLTITLRDGSELSVLIDSRTIISVERRMGSVADLMPGRKVEVHVRRNEDGSLTAVAIKVEIEDEGDHDFEIHGMVTALGDGTITVRTMRVGDVVFAVNDATVVTRDDTVIRLADIRLGDIVEIHAVSDAAGVLTAVKIEVESMPDGMEIEIEGEVTAVSTSSITLMTSRGSTTFEVTSETEVLIDGEEASITDVIVGDDAEVKARMRQGTYVAERIKVEREDD